jgi:two-component system OmpR family response regulator
MKILVVEDEPEMSRLIAKWLQSNGYETEVAINGLDGFVEAQSGMFGAALLDVMLPGMSGLELTRRVRDSGSNLPIMLLTARDAIDDRVRGLDAGADDYLVKPFDLAELGARLRALLRRDAAGQRSTLVVGQLRLDAITMTTTVQGLRVILSPREFAVLRLLAASPGTVVRRSTMLEEIWGSSDNIDPNIVEQYMSFLRRKIDSQLAGVRISTVRGRGYKLDVL